MHHAACLVAYRPKTQSANLLSHCCAVIHHVLMSGASEKYSRKVQLRSFRKIQDLSRVMMSQAGSLVVREAANYN